MVTARNDGNIIGFVFYVIPSSILQVASVVTDKGIGAGASLQDILKAHGEPYKRRTYKDSSSDLLELFYRQGDVVLSFRFDSGTLKVIAINAGYLPYLPK